MGTSVLPGLVRTGQHFDGWFPLGPDAQVWRERWAQVQTSAQAANRAGAVTGAMYCTISLHDDAAEAARILEDYLSRYYAPAPPAMMRRVQACYAGIPEGLAAWLAEFVSAGVSHLVLRFAGDHDKHLEFVSRIRTQSSIG